MTGVEAGQAPFDDALGDLEQQVFSDPHAAIQTGSTLLPQIDQDGSIGQRIAVRRILATAHAHVNQFKDALRLCEDARALPGASDAPHELSRVSLASMQPFMNLGRTDEAIAAGKEALEMAERLNLDGIAGRAALNIGAVYATTGHHADALAWFDRASTHFPDDDLASDPIMRGQIQTNRGTALAALDRFAEAEEAFQRASSALSAADIPWAQAIAEGNLADLAARQGDINRSLRHFENSRRHLEQDEAWGDLGRLNAEQAAALAMAGLTSVARDTFTEAIAMLREHGTPADLAMAQVSYGTALADAGLLDEAELVLAESRELVPAEEQPSIYLQVLLLRARLAIARGNLDDARDAVTGALPLVADRPVQRLRWSAKEARIARFSGNKDRAQAILRDALNQAQEARIAPLVADLATSLAELARESGDHDAADTAARQAIDATERVRDTIQAERIRQSWHRGRLDIYEDLYRSTLAKSDPRHQAEAFDLAERIRSRTLLDAMHIRSADLDRRRPASGAEQALLDERARHQRWLNWMYSSLADGAEPSSAQLEELHVRERAVAQLDDRLETLRPPSPLGSPLPLANVQGLLAQDHAVLAFLRVEDTYTAQIITRTGAIGITDLAAAKETGALVAQLQFQLNRALAQGNRPVSPNRQARLLRDTDTVLSALYDTLIGPVARHIENASRLIVIPSSDLYGVPFGALLGPDGYLVDRHEIATAPGVTILASLRSDKPDMPHRPLIAGVPDDDAPGLGEEARFVANLFPEATTLLEGEATRQAVLEAMPQADLIHLACHGRFDSVHPTASGLRLADGWLTLAQLVEVHLNDPEVMLTGCETGRVRAERGDDLVGIIVALIASGARGLVTSLWKTHDRAATASMAAYYDAITRGMAPLAALRHSQLEVRSQFPHPAHWAPFIGVHASRKGAHS